MGQGIIQPHVSFYALMTSKSYPVTKYCNKMNLTTIFLSTAQLTTLDFHRADMNNTLSVNTLSTTRNMAIIKNGRIINPQLFY